MKAQTSSRSFETHRDPWMQGPGVAINCFPKSERSRGRKSLLLANVFAVEVAGVGPIAAHSRLTGKVDKICGLAPQLNR
jgi:hypothetical protein